MVLVLGAVSKESLLPLGLLDKLSRATPKRCSETSTELMYAFAFAAQLDDVLARRQHYCTQYCKVALPVLVSALQPRGCTHFFCINTDH